MLKMMQTKYEAAMKEKMLVKLERDRLASRVGALEAQLRQVEAARAAEGAGAAAPAAKEPKGPRVSRLPEENRANPYLTMDLPAPKVERWGLSKTFNAHTLGVADVAAHPTKPIVATASDDGARKRRYEGVRGKTRVRREAVCDAWPGEDARGDGNVGVRHP